MFDNLVYNKNMDITTIMQGYDAIVVTSSANLFYLSGIASSDAMIMLTNERSVYITSKLYEVEASEKLPSSFDLEITDRASYITYLRRELTSCAKVGVEMRSMTADVYFKIFDSLKCVVSDISERFDLLRTGKRSSELRCIKRAEAMVDAAFDATIPLLVEGITEKEVRAILQNAMLREGADGFAFDTIVAFGENAAKPHAVPSDRPLKKGDCIVMDFGAKCNGYCSDFTRTLYCGEPNKSFKAAYDLVLKAQTDAIDYLLNGGRNCREADSVARNVIDRSAFRGCFTHTLGHGVGIEIHEAPTLSQKSTELLLEGEVFTVEPGIYVEGEFGIRIESLLTIENGKVTVIDRSNKEIITV